MPAVKQNLVIEQGATFTKRLVWRGSNKKPINLTGYTAKMQVKGTVADVTALLELSTTNGKIVLSASAGSITMKLSPTDTAAITTWATGIYDLVLTAPDTSKVRLLEGKISVSKGVTT